MPIRTLLILCAVLAGVPAARAQVEYVTGGAKAVSAGAFLEQSDGIAGRGLSIEIVPTSQLGVTLEYGWADADLRIERLSLERPGRLTSWAGTVMAYPRRQGMNGAVTLGVGFAGAVTTSDVTLRDPLRTRRFTERTITVGLNASVSRAFTEAGRPLRTVTTAEGAVFWALSNNEPTLGWALRGGFGAGLRVGGGVMFIVEPSVLVTVLGGDVATAVVGSAGLAYAL